MTKRGYNTSSKAARRKELSTVQIKMEFYVICQGCDIVQSDRAPQVGVAQGISMEISSGAGMDIR